VKYKSWIYGGLVTLLLVLAGAWAFAPRPVQVELAAATQAHFETTIDEDGKTRLADRYVVSAPLAGRLARVGLHEGDVVNANAVLAQLTPALPALLDERSLRELQARLEGAQARVQQATARIERAQVAYALAQGEANRSDQLAQQGFIAPTKQESERLGALGAKKEVDAAVEDRHVASHDVEQARAALGVAKQPSAAAAGNAFAVRAPVAGQVLRVLQSSEGLVALGAPLVEIGDISKLEIVAELLTTDALAATPGSAVRIERWGGAGVLQGRVKRVEPAAFTKVSALGVEEQRVRVIIDITSPQEQWRQLGDGYRVSVRIVTQAQEQALQVPVSAVFPLPTKTEGAPSQYAVFVLSGGRAHLQPVELAARNGNMAWLKSGVASGAQVIVYPPSSVRDGDRVSARKV
jgi:HlyD family secretion protein